MANQPSFLSPVLEEFEYSIQFLQMSDGIKPLIHEFENIDEIQMPEPPIRENDRITMPGITIEPTHNGSETFASNSFHHDLICVPCMLFIRTTHCQIRQPLTIQTWNSLPPEYRKSATELHCRMIIITKLPSFQNRNRTCRIVINPIYHCQAIHNRNGELQFTHQDIRGESWTPTPTSLKRLRYVDMCLCLDKAKLAQQTYMQARISNEASLDGSFQTQALEFLTLKLKLDNLLNDLTHSYENQNFDDDDQHDILLLDLPDENLE